MNFMGKIALHKSQKANKAWTPLQWRHSENDGVSITSLTIVYSTVD